jgi:hypothetical protein
MGIAEGIALAGLAVAGLGLGGAAVKALWSISRGLGVFEGKIVEMLKNHANTLVDHEDRIRNVEDLVK